MTALSSNETTSVLAIIGDPVKQAKSPATFADYFTLHGIDAVMVPLHVSEKDFLPVLEGLRAVKNFAGAVITIPHKYHACRAAYTRGPMAIKTGTANVLTPIGKNRWSAEMLDGIGLINALEKRSIAIRGLRTLLIGAGGAGTAIGVALEQLGQVASIAITDPDRTRAENLLAKLQHAEITGPDPAGYQLVINASPIGMGSNESPADATRITAGTIVCDAIMEPPKTRFLQIAEQRGCTIVEGREMLLGQVEDVVRFFGLQAR